ncbi:DUF2065 domain-containing protein [bacterium]|nr:DUF2065 domain-containing protein [bacterium]
MSRGLMKYFLTALGLALILEGMPYFLAPGAIKKTLEMIKEQPEKYLRLFGLTAMLSGVVLLYMVNVF